MLNFMTSTSLKETALKKKGTRKKSATKATSDADLQAQAIEAVRAAYDKKAENLKIIDVRESGFTDYFIIASALSDRQVHAIADHIEKALREKFGRKPLSTEGKTEGRWVILDYGDYMVHLFQDAIRDFYALEEVWAHAPRIPLPKDIFEPAAAPSQH